MSRHLRLPIGTLVTVVVMLLALLPAVTATATEGVMDVTADTTLTEDHFGPIEINASDVTLDCADYRVIGSGSGNGIFVGGRTGVTVRNCLVSGFGNGIVLNNSSGNTIEANNVHNNMESGKWSVGIGVLGSSSNNAITANVVADNGDPTVDGQGGIHLGAGAASNTIAGNTVTGNRWRGINISDGNVVRNNEVRGNGDHGLAVGGDSNRIEANEVIGNGASEIAGDGSGIRLGDGANGNLVVNNHFDGNVIGISPLENASGNTFTGNTAHSNTNWGIQDSSSGGTGDRGTDNQYVSNLCVGNGDGGSSPVGLCNESGSFTDDDGNTFELDIEWLAAEGITKGCNPPANDRFCPDDNVTRGQMAAFLVRALDLPAAPSAGFTDTVGTTFEKDIDRLAAAGITKGCNPPANDRFCPDDRVRREVMAAFLVRAMGYTDDGGGDLFTDDDGSIFETDIDRLATAGVTKGCNPPQNDRFCPSENVTRGQMAAFLRRALS